MRCRASSPLLRRRYKDGVELAPDVNIMMTRDVDTCVYTLKIRNTGDEDMGDYACVATNEHGEMREEVRLRDSEKVLNGSVLSGSRRIVNAAFLRLGFSR